MPSSADANEPPFPLALSHVIRQQDSIGDHHRSSAVTAASALGSASPRAGSWWAVVVVALCAAAFHMYPFWRAELSTPPGWTFAENTTISPDYMQYRVWERQAATNGPLVENTFTVEPNRPHLFVGFYWAIGSMARALRTTPERVYAYLGMPLAFALVLLIYAIVRHFVSDGHAAWWIFLSTVFGGGLGAHLKILNDVPRLRDWYPFQRVVSESLQRTALFEDYRSHYVVKTLLDSHFLLIWLLTLGAVFAFYGALRRGTLGAHVTSVVLFVLATLLHPYEGITLVAIAMGMVVCCWPLREYRRSALTALIANGIATAAVLLFSARLFRASGLPVPQWRAIDILFSTLLIAFPAAFALMAWDWRAFWQRAELPQRVLAGWMLGCVALTLSGPFYPYPDRGTMTLQVPVMIIGGLIYFARWPRLTWRAAAVAVVLMGATPVWLIARTWRNTAFREDTPWMFTNAAHAQVQQLLQTRAKPTDVLAADAPDLLWLAPTYPGRHFAGHFFLTVDYDRKQAQLERLLTSASSSDAGLLSEGHVRWFFVGIDRQPARFARIPDLTVVAQTTVGWLFEYAPPARVP